MKISTYIEFWEGLILHEFFEQEFQLLFLLVGGAAFLHFILVL